MPGRYKSVLRAKETERFYPLRVRIRVPPDGLRRTDTDMHAWLTQRLGERYGTSSGGVALDHFIYVHLPTVDSLLAFLTEFRDRLDIDLAPDAKPERY